MGRFVVKTDKKSRTYFFELVAEEASYVKELLNKKIKAKKQSSSQAVFFFSL